MDPATRKEADARLKRVAGQITGIQRMVAGDRYCVDVLLQIAAVQAALGEVGRMILAKHVETCLVDAIQSHGPRERRKKIDELMEIFARYCLLGTRSRKARGAGAGQNTRTR